MEAGLEEFSRLGQEAKALIPAALRAADMIVEAYRNEGKVVLFGNGGSATDAQHIAGELMGRFRFDRPPLAAIALPANIAFITAVANDLSYERVFERGVEGLVRRGDIVIALSTSGESPNVLKGVKAAHKKGAKVIGFCGVGGSLAGLCDVALSVPSADTPRIQEVHLALGHIVCELVEEELFGAGKG